MIVRDADYPEYSEIVTEPLEKQDGNELSEALRSQVRSRLNGLSQAIPHAFEKKTVLLNSEFVDLKVQLNAQMCPRIKLWSQLVPQRPPSPSSENESKEDAGGKAKEIGTLFAVKIYSKPQLMKRNIVYSPDGRVKTQLHRALNEIKILQFLQRTGLAGNHIVKLHKVLESSPSKLSSGKLYLLFEFHPLGPTMESPAGHARARSAEPGAGAEPPPFGGNGLFYKPNPRMGKREKDVGRLARCIAIALARMHDLGIAHRDVKPDNILLGEDRSALLSDFNSAEFLSQGKFVVGTEGTYAFFPPEFCQIFEPAEKEDPETSSPKKQLGCPADMWALGVTIWCWFFHSLPFQGDSILELFQHISQCRVELPPYHKLSEHCVQAIKGLMHPDPTSRWTAQQFLESEWISSLY